MGFAFRQRGAAGRTEPARTGDARTGDAKTGDSTASRPGLPIELTRPASPAGPQAAAVRDIARQAAEARRRDEAAREQGKGKPEEGKAGESAAGTTEQSGPDGAAQNESEVGGGAAGTATDEGVGTAGEGESAAAATRTPVALAEARPPDVFRSVRAPALPPAPIPDLSRIRSIVVPPPPASAIRRSADILRATGSTPGGHHAQIQRGMDAVADRARGAQRNVIFQVGGIAADARHAIEALAERIPGVVAGGAARIRAAAASMIADVNAHADAQIKVVLDHKAKADAGLVKRGEDTEVEMQQMLLKEAPKVLKDAKAQMDAEIDALAKDAGGRIAGIKSGVMPAAMDTGVSAAPGAKPADAPPADGDAQGPYTTWPAARAALVDKLMGDLPANRTAQYGNLQCAGASPSMVEAQQRAYEAANDETVKRLTSPETKARFFDITFGLIMPTIAEEEEKATRVADESYTGHLNLNLTREYFKLDTATRRIVRQIDEKRGVLVSQTLDPSKEKSMPAQSIKGLREAGQKIMDGLNDQARIVEASLKANLASLAAHYPDLVARLEPLVASGEFLEATATLVQLAEAEKSIGALEGGQIAAVAEQAMKSLANARSGFDQQVASLYKMTQSSVDGLLQTLARARYDFVRTTMMYTGVMDRGVTSVFPQIHAHAEQVAERLLGPKDASRQKFSNIKTAAVGYLNGVIAAEWSGYLARVNGLEATFGGVADAAWKLEDSGSEFGRIRNGAAQDASARGNDVRAALTPAPLSTGERIGGYLLFGVGAVIYDIYSNPNESKVTTALAIPWPGPNAVDERHKSDSGTGVVDLIRERMQSEEEQADILKLFDPDQNVRAAGKAGLLEGSSASTGINAAAALALSQSLTADELAAPIMTPEKRQRIAEELRSELKPADMEVAAAYLNGEPDQALAIRMRQLFDKQAREEEKTQLQTGEELDRLIRQELFGGGQYAYVPKARLDAMRDAAFLRFDEISREGRAPVTVKSAPVAPPPDRLALSPAQLRYQGRPPPPPKPKPATDAPKSPATRSAGPTGAAPATAPAPKATQAAKPPPASPAPAPVRATIGPEAPNETLTPESAATDRGSKLDEARRAIVAYMNRPRASYYRRPEDPYAEADMRRYSAMDRKIRTYDPATGRVTIAPALAVQDYNKALILHGPNSPEALGARAAASYSRISTDGALSNNQINELNQNFSDMEYARVKARWDHATLAQKEAMAEVWSDAQKKHQAFLRETAGRMGMKGDLDNAQAVEAFVSERLGAQFAKEGDDFADAGKQIASQGRMAIDTGVALAAHGVGTNEALMQAILANRTHAELNMRRANGETMHDYAYRVADDEMSGDDWHQAKEKLRGDDENEFERFGTLQFLKDQQMKEGTGWLGRNVMSDAWQKRHLEKTEDAAENRLRDATRAGAEEYNARMEAAGRPDLRVAIPGDLPVRTPDGQINPLIQRFAVNGDGKLRGGGPSMDALQTDTRQAAGFYQEELDRNESVFTSLITALAVIVSVICLIIPGVNLIAAGILTALISGAATIAVKSGMRGGRYGWEEMATDIGMTAIEAATAGIGGAMSKGASAAAKAAATGAKLAKLGRVASVGARIQMRFGPVAAPIIQGAITGAASTAASAALDDKLWDDGIGRGVGRVLGHGVKGGMSGAANAAVTGAITRGLDRRLAPTPAGRAANADRLNRIGRALGPGGREFLTEILSNTTGSLTGETINILADLTAEKEIGGWSGALQRLGHAGVRELVSVAGRTGVQQTHRARYNRMSADIHAERRVPSPAEARLLNRLGQSAGIVPMGTKTEDFADQFARVRARIDEMPPQIRADVARMSPEKALDVIHMLDSGQLGDRTRRLQFTLHLGKEIADIDVEAFDRALQSANRDFAPTRRARRQEQAETNRQMLSGVRGPERARLRGMDFGDDFVGLPPAAKARLASALSDGGADFKALAHQLLPGDAPLAARVASRMATADEIVTRARNAVATRRATIRNDLQEATPEALRKRIAGLTQRSAETLHAALRDDGGDGFARAVATLRGAGLDAQEATKLARQMMDRSMRSAARIANLDNVPPAHVEAMLALRDDALMEIRVAQFTRKPLSDARVEEIVAAAATRRPGTDRTALAAAIRATMANRHGRPGFREALSQKRALLDMIPFGMKRNVYRTPVITLPEESFLAYVRGKGNENAVTLIVNGEPVILMRQGADVKVLAEEGLHVLQYRDPHFRDRIGGLGEERMAQWDDLDLDTQVRAYRAKLDVEIDGQQRMIARLRRREDSAFFAQTRRQAREQRAVAEETLARLTARRGEAAALSPAQMEAMAAGLVDPPRWLRQPARMFSKSAAELESFDEIHDAHRQPVKSAFLALAARADMSRGARRQLVLTIHALADVAPIDEMVAFLGRIRSAQPAPGDEALAKLPADRIAVTIRNHFLNVGDPSRTDSIANKVLERMSAKRGLGDNDLKIVRATLKRLSQTEAGGAHADLEFAKRALILGLHRLPPNEPDDAVMDRFRSAAKVLGTSRTRQMKGLENRPDLQATILEALAGTRPHSRHEAYFKTVAELLDASAHLSAGTQHEAFKVLTGIYFENTPDETFRRYVNLVRTMDETLAPDALRFVDRHPDRHTELLPKISGLMEAVVDFHAKPPPPPAAGKVTVEDMFFYFKEALQDPKIGESLIRMGSRAEAKAKLSDADLEALRTGEAITVGQESFLTRFGRPLKDAEASDDYKPIVIKREQVAEDLMKLANSAAAQKGASGKITLSIEEARSIVQRLEVLEASIAFSALTGAGRSRDDLMGKFLQTLASVPQLTTESGRNRRGRFIEESFRHFVRDEAKAVIDSMATKIELPGPNGTTVKLSAEARVGLINLLIRGVNDVANPMPLDPVVKMEIDHALRVVRENYLASGRRILDAGAFAQFELGFDSLVRRGLVQTERTAKGKMQENLIETLLAIKPDPAKPDVPASYGEVSSQTATVQRNFRSVDQADDANATNKAAQRSTDHVLQVEKDANLPPGMKKGQLIQTDSKAGPNAFDDEQFKRYFVEMARLIAGEPKSGLFVDSGAAALAYIADNHANQLKTYANVMRVMEKILTAKGGNLVIEIAGESFDLTARYGITRERILANADQFVVHFGRIAQASDAHTPGGAASDLKSSHMLGPFLFQTFETDIAAKIRELLGDGRGAQPAP